MEQMGARVFALRNSFRPIKFSRRNISANPRRHIPQSIEEWPLRRVEIIADEPYERLPMGCSFKSTFVDTGSQYTKVPVILLLHDNPGSHHQLGALINSFQKLNTRVIATNYPGNRFTKGSTTYDDIIFKYSTFERSFIVDSIIAQLNIDRVDGVVALGFGCYPALQLLISASNLYRSACFLNFPGLSPTFPVSPLLTDMVAKLWSSNILLRSLIRSLLHNMKVKTKLGSPAISVDEAAYSLISHANIDFHTLVTVQAPDLASTDMPLMLVSTEWNEVTKEASLSVGCPISENRPQCLTSTWGKQVRFPLDQLSRRRHHFYADCNRKQLISEAFFTDVIAQTFLSGFVERRKS